MRREQEILQAALELFRGSEWESVTIEQIAQAAEVGKGTIYKHFASKDEIYARLATYFHERLLAELRALDASGEIPARLSSALLTVWRSHQGAGLAVRRVLEQCDRRSFQDRLPDRARGRLLELESARAALIEEILEAGIGQRIFPRKPMELLTFGVASALQGGIRAALRGEVSREDLEGHLTEL
ncbi:MAG TPA: TetR/AcrR family transcriptional regulator, partial [Gemmatimonadaceae bacterium]|nr:TetR/AcrR family transcriptional regulator [Gemmatimonadaceae bacterium]